MLDISNVSRTHKLLALAVTVLALVAVCLSSYLTWVTWQQSTVAGCTGSAAIDCDEVLSSSGSKWLGIPVSLFGLFTYAGILALVWPAVVFGGWAMTSLLSLAMLAAGAGLWFVGTQALVVQHFCLYCMTIHLCGLLICVSSIFLMRREHEANYDHMRAFFGGGEETFSEPSPSEAFQPLIAAGVAAIGLVALIGGQVFLAPSGMEVVEDLPLVIAEDSNDTNLPAEPTGDPIVVSDELGPDVVEVTASNETDSDQDDDVAFELFDEPEADPLPESTVEADLQEPEPPREVDNEATGLISSDNPPPKEPTETKYEFDESLFTISSQISQEAAKPVLDNLPAVSRYFRFKYLRREIDAEGNPVVGNPYAPHRLVEMLDYTCPHCRKLHPYIHKAVERYGDQLGFVIYHVPLSRKCNPQMQVDQVSHKNACDYAKLAYGVWKLNPKKFAEYHDWLMKGEKVPPVYEAKSKAMALVGEAILIDKSIEAEHGKRVADAAKELGLLKVGLPVLIFDQGVVKGMPKSEREWFQVLESRLGVKPVATVVN